MLGNSSRKSYMRQFKNSVRMKRAKPFLERIRSVPSAFGFLILIKDKAKQKSVCRFGILDMLNWQSLYGFEYVDTVFSLLLHSNTDS